MKSNRVMAAATATTTRTATTTGTAPEATEAPPATQPRGAGAPAAPGGGDGRGRLPGAARRAQIIEATLRLVAEHGLVGASMSRIADAVGISNAALYRHFASREDILIGAHDALMDRIFAWLKSSEAPNVVDRLRWMGESHAPMFSRDIEGFNAPMFQFISWIPKDRVYDHVVKRRVEMIRWYADLVEEGKAQGSIRTDIETDLIVSELFAWIWWEDLSYLEGLDTETTLRGSANMFARLLTRISAGDVDSTHASVAGPGATRADGSSSNGKALSTAPI